MSNQPQGGKQDGRTREARATANESAPQRPRSNRAGKLSIPLHLIKPGYQPYLAIDKPGNIEQMLSEGWEFIYGDGSIQRTSEDAAQGGTKFTIPAGGGFTYYGLQMRPEWYADLQAERRAELAEVENALKTPSAHGLPQNAELYEKDRDGNTFGLKTGVKDIR
jgi:hypothetical protein